MTTHIITKGDTGTPLELIVGDKDGPWDLTDATVKFRYSIDGVTSEKTLTPDADQVNNKGKASATWSTELASVAPENYACQVKVTFPNASVRYAPLKGYAVLTVQAPL